MLKENWVKSYLDDIMVYARTYNTVLHRLNRLFKYMTTVGFKSNLSKCYIGQREVKFLGHVVSSEGYKPDPSNIEAIQKMKPSNGMEVRRFLGMVGFYRQHIDQFSKLAIPLADLTEKGKSFVWSTDYLQAVEKLKGKLLDTPVLTKADISKPFILDTDASASHVCAVLMQYDNNKKLKVIAYFSKKLKPTEVKYSATDRDALGIVLACRQFHHYLWGSRVVIRTDHQPLVCVFIHRSKSPRMKRVIR